MSRTFIKKVLNEAKKQIEQDIRNELALKEQEAKFSVDIIRDAFVKQLTFTYSSGKVKYAVWDSLTERKKENTIKKIEEISKNILVELRDVFAEKATSSKDGRSGVSLSITEYKDGGNLEAFVVNAVLKKSKAGKLRRGNPYNTIQSTYISLMNKGWAEIVKVVYKKLDKETIAKLEQTNVRVAKGKYQKATEYFENTEGNFDFGHSEGSSVAEKRKTTTINTIESRLKTRNRRAYKGIDVAAVLKNLKIKLTANYQSLDDISKIFLTVESGSINRSRGSIDEKNIIQGFKDDIDEYLRELTKASPKNAKELGLDPKNIRGSDSRVEIEKKKIVKAFNSKLDLPTKGINSKLNLSSHSISQNIKINPTITKETLKPLQAKITSKNTPKRREKRGSANSLVSLKDLLNASINKQVAGNMKSPALVYRTGRFANSVQVTDVTETPQGYPSIGYTYMKYPYQTFEVGYAQGNPDRDPRKLIDRSIREVASELLIGRFYTRRV
jgi:hypothetical protein